MIFFVFKNVLSRNKLAVHEEEKVRECAFTNIVRLRIKKSFLIKNIFNASLYRHLFVFEKKAVFCCYGLIYTKSANIFFVVVVIISFKDPITASVSYGPSVNLL